MVRGAGWPARHSHATPALPASAAAECLLAPGLLVGRATDTLAPVAWPAPSLGVATRAAPRLRHTGSPAPRAGGNGRVLRLHAGHGPARRDSAWAHRARLGGRQADNGACVRRRHGARCWRGPAYRLPASRLLALSLLPPPEPRARLRASRQGAQRAGGTLSDACAVRLWAWRGVHRGRPQPRQPHRLQGASAPSAAACSRLCASGCLSCAGSDRVRRFPGR